MLTIKQIAKLCNVSTGTVSRVINQRPGVSPETIKRVKGIIRRYKYRPNVVARSLATKRSNSIGVLLADITNPFYAELVEVIEREARKAQYVTIFFSTHSDQKLQKRGIDFLRANRVDGIVFASVLLHDPDVERLAGEGFPFVLVNRRLEDDIADYVVEDNVLGGYKATEHLHKLGHRRIGIINGPISLSTGLERFEGYRRALRDNGLAVERELIKVGDFRKGSGYEAMLKFLEMPKRPSAVFATNDYMAMGAFEAILDKGLGVPEHIALVGYDDFEWASFGRIRLTTIRGNKSEMGRQGIRLLMGKINQLGSERGTPPSHVLLEPQLIIRDTCGYRRNTGGS
jgi:LacI family transcriptional regulator